MKLLVISDTHGKLVYAKEVIHRLTGSISAVIHLGDMLSDARELEAANTELPFHYVAGNCDFYYSAEKGMLVRKTLEYNGVKILLTHGHMDGVKHGYSKIADAAKKEGAPVVLCGHTHEPYNKIVNGVLCVNPGSISMPRGNSSEPTYAVLDIPDDGLSPPRAGIVSIRGSRV